MTSTLPAVEQASVGGVRVLHAPIDGPQYAALTFRVGWVDEPLPMHGLAHLLEHLVLAPLGQPSFSWNGYTTAEQMGFHCQGTADQVHWFMGAVTGSIRALQLQHLEAERRILRSEGCHRSSGLAGLHDIWRWGAQGHGLGSYDELGLAGITAEHLQQHAARFLTADNAVLWTTVPHIRGDFTLPRGTSALAPEPGAWRATPTPSVFREQVRGLSVSGELGIGQWAGLVAWLLEQRLSARLRYQEGIAYGVSSDVASVGRDLRRVLLAIDALPEAMDRVAVAAHETLQELAHVGPTQSELDRYCADFDARLENDHAVLHDMASAADQLHRGQPVRSIRSVLEEVRSLPPTELRACVPDLLATALWCGPPGVTVPSVPPAPWCHQVTVRGTRFTPPAGLGQTTFVEVSPEGISFVDETQSAQLTIPWTDCVGVLDHEDGSMVLVGRDGYRISLFPEAWARFAELRGQVQRHAPAGAWTRQSPPPERPVPAPPLRVMQPTSSVVWGMLAGCLWFLAATFVLVGIDDGAPGMVAAGVALAASGALPVVHVVRRRRRRRAGTDAPFGIRELGPTVWPSWVVVAGTTTAFGILPLGWVMWHVVLWPAGLVGSAGAAELARRSKRSNGSVLASGGRHRR